jgi:hypothetical protein
MIITKSDGMTKDTTKTPKEGVGSHRHACGTFIEHRVIGVEVVCGPVKGMFIYTTDNMLTGNANGMIEIIRQAQADLARILFDDYDMEFPDKVMYQFDNCTENKNKALFGYLSLLVETEQFREIEANFLIVGHTHSSIDQYFSVLSRKIRAAGFIGTSMSMQYLLQHAHGDSTKRPLVYRPIEVSFQQILFLGI